MFFFHQTREFFNNHLVQWLLVATVVLAGIHFWVVFLNFHHEMETIILHYNVYLGVDAVGNWQRAYRNPTIGIAISGLNILLGYIAYLFGHRMATYVLYIGAILIQIGLGIATSALIMVNR